jgi:hypothetical protein
MSDADQQGGRHRSGGLKLDTSTLNSTVAQLYFKAIIRQDAGSFISPFDRHDRRPAEIISDTDRFRLLQGVEPVEVDMRERQPAAIFMQEHERRAADSFGRRPESGRYPAYERSLACSERTRQCDGFSSLEHRSDGAAQPIGMPRRR